MTQPAAAETGPAGATGRVTCGDYSSFAGIAVDSVGECRYKEERRFPPNECHARQCRESGREAMLVSRTHRLAFAHYPKTAGTSLQHWFLDTCPDAALLVPDNPHYPVGLSLERLRPQGFRRRLGRFTHRSLKLLSPALADHFGPFPASLRIVGVIRDPFEMLVSLFEFWKRDPLVAGSTDAFIGCTQHRTFRDFLAAAVIGGRIATYETFFDVGGPLWHKTYLLDFESLQPALEAFCGSIGLGHARPLPSLNRSPAGGRDLQRYRDEAGPLMEDVRRHFRWYYEEGVHLMIRGNTPLRAAA